MTSDILYIALVLDEESQNKLKDFLEEILQGVDFCPQCFCHHSTLAFRTSITDEIMDFTMKHLGEAFPITADKLGISNKAIAVGVQHACPCANKAKHITLATNVNENGKPKDSNEIVNWSPMLPISLQGELAIVRKK